MGFLPALDTQEKVAWVTLEDSQPLSDIDWKILTFVPPPEEDNSQYRKKIGEIMLCLTCHYLYIELMLMNAVVILFCSWP